MAQPKEIIARRASTEADRAQYGAGDYVDIGLGFAGDTNIQRDIDAMKAGGYSIINDLTPGSSTNIVSDTSTVRSDKAEGDYTVGKIKEQLDSLSSMATGDLQKRMAEIDAQMKNINTNTSADQQQIEEAGRAAGLAFDPLIRQAEEEARQGNAKALVAGGEQGGFMNTQMSGVAAILPTEGGSFVGAGGKLAEIKGQFDANIQRVKIAKEQAIAAARAAAQQAATTRRREDVGLAMQALNQVKSINEMEANLANQKIEAMYKAKEFEQKQKSTVLDDAEKIFAVGGQLTPDLKASLDASYGVGFSDKYAEAQRKAKEASDEASKMDAAKSLVDILQKVPAGKKFTFNGSDYEGYDAGDRQIFNETDANGNVTFITIDKATGQVVSTVKGGKVGKPTKATGGVGGTLEEVPSQSFDEWLKGYQEKTGTTYKVSDPNVKAKLTAIYKQEVPTTTKTTTSIKTLKSSLNDKDLQAMIRQGLNPDSAADITQYLKNNKTNNSEMSRDELLNAFLNSGQ